MLIISFGSGLNMEDESPANYAKFKELRDYADSRGIELGDIRCYRVVGSAMMWM